MMLRSKTIRPRNGVLFTAILVILCQGILMSGCRVSRKLTTARIGTLDINAIAEQYGSKHKIPDRIWIKRFSGRLRIDDYDRKLKGHLRLVKDSLLIINIQTAMNVEAARLYLDRDSLLVINRVGRRYYHEAASKVQLELSKFIDLNLLQSILYAEGAFLTNSIWNNKTKFKERLSDDMLCLEGDQHIMDVLALKGPTIIRSCCFVSTDSLLRSAHYTNETEKTEIKLNFPSYVQAGEYNLASEVIFTVLQEGQPTFGLELQLEKIQPGEVFPTSRRISSQYQRVFTIADI